MRPVTLSAAKAIASTLAALALVGGALEGAARAAAGLGAFTPNLADSYELGAKHELYLAQAAAEGYSDCLIVGPSVALQGFNPAAVEQAVRERSGQDLRCFNFASSGLSAPQIVTLATALARRAPLRVLVYGANYLDFIHVPGSRPYSGPWLDDLAGRPNLQGALEANSYLYRALLTLRWANRADANTLAIRRKFESEIQPDGFDRVIGIWPHIDKRPAARSSEPYEASPEALAALQSLAELQRAGTTVIIIDVPMPPNSHYLLARGDEDFAVYIDAVSAAAAQAGLPFWQARELIQPITDAQGWADPIHLNGTGANLFSAWFGERLAEALR